VVQRVAALFQLDYSLNQFGTQSFGVLGFTDGTFQFVVRGRQGVLSPQVLLQYLG